MVLRSSVQDSSTLHHTTASPALREEKQKEAVSGERISVPAGVAMPSRVTAG